MEALPSVFGAGWLSAWPCCVLRWAWLSLLQLTLPVEECTTGEDNLWKRLWCSIMYHVPERATAADRWPKANPVVHTTVQQQHANCLLDCIDFTLVAMSLSVGCSAY